MPFRSCLHEVQWTFPVAESPLHGGSLFGSHTMQVQIHPGHYQILPGYQSLGQWLEDSMRLYVLKVLTIPTNMLGF